MPKILPYLCRHKRQAFISFFTCCNKTNCEQYWDLKNNINISDCHLILIVDSVTDHKHPTAHVLAIFTDNYNQCHPFTVVLSALKINPNTCCAYNLTYSKKYIHVGLNNCFWAWKRHADMKLHLYLIGACILITYVLLHLSSVLWLWDLLVIFHISMCL